MQQKKAYLIDTNVILRFLLNDIPDQANKAKYFLEKIENGVEKAYLTELILSECIWVLEKFYKIPKKEIISKIKSLILFEGFITQTSKTLLLEALNLWDNINIDWTDAFLSAFSKEEHLPIVSFDTDFDKISEVKRKIP